MSTLADFYDYVMPELNGITTTMVDQQLRMVSRDFCERTRAWRAVFDPTNLVAAQATYDLSPSESQAETVQVHKLTVNSVILFDDLWSDESTATAPTYDRAHPPFTISDDLAQITLITDEIPTAAVTAGLAITGSMKPTRTATQLPDMLLNVHLEAIRTGVLARLMVMANRPWTALAQSGMYRMDYDRHIQHAAANAQLGNTRRILRAKKWG